MRRNERRWGWLLATGALWVAVIGLSMNVRDAGAADSKTTWLGVYTQSLTDDLREGLNFNGDGVLINRVVSDSPADKAGLRKGDVILRFNNRSVEDPDALIDAVRAARSGQRVSVLVSRDGTRKTINVTLGEREEDRSDESWSWSDGDRHVVRVPRIKVERMDGDDGDSTFDLDIPNLRFLTMGRGRLGVQVQNMNDGLGEYFNTNRGALVLDVVEDSPAEKAGIKAGDVIVGLGGEAVDDANDLIRAMRKTDEGPVSVKLIRKGREQTVKADIEKAAGQSWTWNDHGPTPEMIRDMRDRARERADRAREQADRARESTRRLSDRDMQREMDQLREELRQLQKRLDEMNDNR